MLQLTYQKWDNSQYGAMTSVQGAYTFNYHVIISDCIDTVPVPDSVLTFTMFTDCQQCCKPDCPYCKSTMWHYPAHVIYCMSVHPGFPVSLFCWKFFLRPRSLRQIAWCFSKDTCTAKKKEALVVSIFPQVSVTGFFSPLLFPFGFPACNFTV